MTEPLLPTPSSHDPGFRNRKPLTKDGEEPTHGSQRCYDAESGRLMQKGLEQVVNVVASATAPSSPVEGDSTSASNGQGGRSPSRSSGTPPPGPASSDGGRLFPVSETSERSMPLLPTPTKTDSTDVRNATKPNRDPNYHMGYTLADVLSASLRSKLSSVDFHASPPAPQDADEGPTTTAGSGPRCSVWYASFDPDSSSWRTSQGSLLSTEETPYERWSGTWPPTFELRVEASGEASVFVPPTWALPTDGSGSSSPSLLPTPAVNDMGEGKAVEDWDAWTDEQREKHGNGNGHGRSLSVKARRLLPTPDAYAGNRGGAQSPEKRRAGGRTVSLDDVIRKELSTGESTPRPSEGGSA